MADQKDLHRNSARDAGTSPTSEPGVPPEALATLEDVLAGFAGELRPSELEDAREFLLDIMAAHPLGHLLSERLRDRPSSAQTEERGTEGSAGQDRRGDADSKKAGGAD